MSKVIILTPIKNEKWILPLFLDTVSTFADHILVADQKSTDGSLEILKAHPKVELIENSDNEYDEASRQKLLIATARQKYGLGHILLCLDADEIPAANLTETLGWSQMLASKPGTIFYIEKPNLFLSPYKTFRDYNPFAIGYKDDGAEHTPKKMHSTRIPTPLHAEKLYLYDVFVLHFALIQLDRQDAKMRFYSVKENVLKTKPFWLRRKAYPAKIKWDLNQTVYDCPETWYKGWISKGIAYNSILSSGNFWHFEEILLSFQKYGSKRFWLDDIWDIDWEKLRQEKSKTDPNYLTFTIQKPPLLLKKALVFFDKFYRFIR